MGMVRQCAWCWLVADASGRYSYQAASKIREATHGICPTCCAREMAALEKHYRQPQLAVATGS
jgi:hypothetical protein